MFYYAGRDLSLRTVNVCVINDQGEFIAETKVKSAVTDVVACFDSLDMDIISVGLEAR
jgi:predicted NBD/HSP70 family sugar kinase